MKDLFSEYSGKYLPIVSSPEACLANPNAANSSSYGTLTILISSFFRCYKKDETLIHSQDVIAAAVSLTYLLHPRKHFPQVIEVAFGIWWQVDPTYTDKENENSISTNIAEQLAKLGAREMSLCVVYLWSLGTLRLSLLFCQESELTFVCQYVVEVFLGSEDAFELLRRMGFDFEA